MDKTDSEKNKKEDKGCPLCDISDQAIEILREKGEQKKNDNNGQEPKK